MAKQTARDVIVQAFAEATTWCNTGEPEAWFAYDWTEEAGAILAALDAAGIALIPSGELHTTTIVDKAYFRQLEADNALLRAVVAAADGWIWRMDDTDERHEDWDEWDYWEPYEKAQAALDAAGVMDR